MPIVVERGTCPQRGVGAPDYSETVSSAKHRAGITAKYKQQLKIFALVFSDSPSSFPWVKTPLAPGASEHLVDQETGDPTPYTVSAGETIAIISIRAGCSQDMLFEIFFDSYPAGGVVIGAVVGGATPLYQEDLLPFSTGRIDATSSHELDDIITNLGTANLYGGFAKLALVETVGTPPPPTTKTTRCPFCGNREVQSIHATMIVCSKCGKLYIVYDLSGVKEIT